MHDFLWILLDEEALAQAFSCEFCGISKNTFFYIRPPVAALQWTFFYKLSSQITFFSLKSYETVQGGDYMIPVDRDEILSRFAGLLRVL